MCDIFQKMEDVIGADVIQWFLRIDRTESIKQEIVTFNGPSLSLYRVVFQICVSDAAICGQRHPAVLCVFPGRARGHRCR